jgi:erythromycin esterase-like protein
MQPNVEPCRIDPQGSGLADGEKRERDSLDSQDGASVTSQDVEEVVRKNGFDYYKAFDLPRAALNEERSGDLAKQLADRVIPLAGPEQIYQWVENSLSSALTQDEWNRVRVVGFGECTHGTKEHFELQATAARYMIEHQNARVLALEVPELFMMLTDLALSDPAAPIADIPRALDCITWSNQAIVDLLLWIREWNEYHPDRRVHVVGLDPKLLPHTPLNLDFVRAFEDISRSYVNAYIPIAKQIQTLENDIWNAVTTRSKLVKQQTSNLEDIHALGAELKKRLERVTAEVEKRFSELPISSGGVSRTPRRFDSISSAHVLGTEALLKQNLVRSLAMLRSVIPVIQSENKEHEKRQRASRAERDSLMFEKVKATLAALDAMGLATAAANESKVVVVAHTMHVGVRDASLEGLDDLGMRIKAELNDAYQVFGSTNYSGTVRAWIGEGTGIAPHYAEAPSGSIEELLHRVGQGSVFLPMRGIQQVLGDQAVALRMKGGGPPLINEFISGIDPETYLTGLWCFESSSGVEDVPETATIASQARLSNWLRLRLIEQLARARFS